MHDLNRIVRDLQESLSLDKHPVAVLIGAGCPVSIRVPSGLDTVPLIPDVGGLTSQIREELKDDPSFKLLWSQFEEDESENITIEDLLSRARLLIRIVGRGNARGLKGDDLAEIEKKMCACISRIVRQELSDSNSPYHGFVDWLAGISRKKAVEVFTTNYDLLLEQALEDRQVPYFDGFIGSRNPFFDLRAIEEDHAPSRWVRLWKLHGSIGWRQLSGGKVTRTFPLPDDSDGLLIHPSELKYDQSRRMPYLAMMDRLRAFLRQPSAFLLTVGYSYADDHLNEMIMQGIRGNPTSASHGLLFKKLDEEVYAKKISAKIPPNMTLISKDKGVVRGVEDKWLPKDLSAPQPSPAECDLGDFLNLSNFLRSLSPVKADLR